MGILLSATLALDVTRAECLWAGSVFDMSSFGKLLDVMCHLQDQLQMQLQAESLFSIYPKSVG